MRTVRRRFLNLAGVFFLLTLLLRIVFLITGLRSYAARAEVPFRIVEMLAVLAAALFTYYISYRFGFLFLTAACVMSIYAPMQELSRELGGADGALNWEHYADRYVFDILLITGLLLLIVLSVLICPAIKRSDGVKHAIRALSVAVILLFAAQLVYRVISLFIMLAVESYPGEFTTKYHYVQMTTYFAFTLTGFACFMTASVRPAEKHSDPKLAEAK